MINKVSRLISAMGINPLMDVVTSSGDLLLLEIQAAAQTRMTLLHQTVLLADLALVFATVPSASTATSKLGRLPAIGPNSWNAFHYDINEKSFLNAANKDCGTWTKGNVSHYSGDLESYLLNYIG